MPEIILNGSFLVPIGLAIPTARPTIAPQIAYVTRADLKSSNSTAADISSVSTPIFLDSSMTSVATKTGCVWDITPQAIKEAATTKQVPNNNLIMVKAL
jgi:hypothetical protein